MTKQMTTKEVQKELGISRTKLHYLRYKAGRMGKQIVVAGRKVNVYTKSDVEAIRNVK